MQGRSAPKVGEGLKDWEGAQPMEFVESLVKDINSESHGTEEVVISYFVPHILERVINRIEITGNKGTDGW